MGLAEVIEPILISATALPTKRLPCLIFVTFFTFFALWLFSSFMSDPNSLSPSETYTNQKYPDVVISWNVFSVLHLDFPINSIKEKWLWVPLGWENILRCLRSGSPDGQHEVFFKLRPKHSKWFLGLAAVFVHIFKFSLSWICLSLCTWF